jgi:hypothetical protein
VLDEFDNESAVSDFEAAVRVQAIKPNLAAIAAR